MVGDLGLVVLLDKGLGGAAWATAAAQVIGALYLFRVMRKLNMKTAVPDFASIKTFLSFCGPLFFVLLVKTFLWVFTTYSVSTSGPVALASHQIVINIFLFFVIFGDVLSQVN